MCFNIPTTLLLERKQRVVTEDRWQLHHVQTQLLEALSLLQQVHSERAVAATAAGGPPLLAPSFLFGRVKRLVPRWQIQFEIRQHELLRAREPSATRYSIE